MIEENNKKFNMDLSNPDGYFTNLVDCGLAPSVSIAVIKKNELIYKFAYGSEKPGEDCGISVTKDTRFNIGSVTKTITGSLIVKFAEMGKLTLNDPVRTYIDEFKFEEITVLDLLTHTSGYSYDLIPSVKFPQKKEEVKDFLQILYEVNSMKFKRGEICEYFTFGYTILMDIIERITQKTLEDNAVEYIFKPSGMNLTTYDTDKLKENTYVLPWDDTIGKLVKETAFTPPSGDSGVFSTATDMVKFGNVFLNKGKSGANNLFAESAVDLMLREVTEGKFKKTPIFWMKANNDIHGCFGDLNSPSSVGHTGFSGCMLFIDPQYETTAAILTNSTKLHADWKNYKRICNLLLSL